QQSLVHFVVRVTHGTIRKGEREPCEVAHGRRLYAFREPSSWTSGSERQPIAEETQRSCCRMVAAVANPVVAPARARHPIARRRRIRVARCAATDEAHAI